MAIQWRDATEIVAGLVLKDRLNPNTVNVDDMYPPYGEIIALCRDEKDKTEIIAKVGFSPVDTAIHAIDAINGSVSPIEWLRINENCASRSKAGINLEKIASALKDGKDVDIGDILTAASKIDMGYRDVTPMSEIEAAAGIWIPTGFGPLDKYVGGIPDASLTVVGASPGVGKTTLMLKLAKSMVKKYKKKRVLIFTLEMTMQHLTYRFLQIDKEVTKEEKSRILLNEDAYNINEVYAIAARSCAQGDVSMVAIDFADQLVEGEQTEAVMGKIYRTCSMLAKKIHTPVVLVSQLNRETYKGGTPMVNHLRYSGMAEAMAALILLIYNPNQILASFASDDRLPAQEGRGYLIVGKARFGFKQGGAGAISVEWDGLSGWGDKAYAWVPLVG